MADALRAAIAAAQLDDETTEGTAEEAEAATEVEESTPISEGEQPEEGTETDAVDEPEATGTGDELEDWFGVPLSGVPAETREALVAKLTEDNAFIQKLLRERAETAPEPATETTPVPEELTDEEVIRALGLDPDDPFDEHTARVAVPLVKRMAELEKVITSVQEETTADQTQKYWDSQLDSLEKEYGSLGIPRDKVYEFVVDEQIGSPADAYWRIAGPTKVAILQELQKRSAAAEVDSKRNATGTRPRTSAKTAPARLESTDTKSAIAEAARLIAQERGLGNIG